MGDSRLSMEAKASLVVKRNSVEARSASDVAIKCCAGASHLWPFAPDTFALIIIMVLVRCERELS